jgi:hypothetical protein
MNRENNDRDIFRWMESVLILLFLSLHFYSQGNLLRTRDGRLCILDFGSTCSFCVCLRFGVYAE